ncbi:uncharacterized protein N7518_003301 [Penicillium psychrosexuale]|uniref:uncharacterized protein n=1 Tax=Penicillium psychrosexuale TaxID=1002107 RepID=UPI002545641C|nr:uncharacterized protein N7518_003301 [Penicillium psychrosexuale]KAJ5801233.1 hypothetical protein N7518_003301 [Penicillium psychrosexuale]
MSLISFFSFFLPHLPDLVTARNDGANYSTSHPAAAHPPDISLISGAGSGLSDNTPVFPDKRMCRSYHDVIQ